MSEGRDLHRWEVPVFAECVIGYRRWRADGRDQLWPLAVKRRPWLPGINTARCNCGDWRSLRFEVSFYKGKRYLEPAPPHAAPAGRCDCGLYSWRRPQDDWGLDRRHATLPYVVGAVASWGKIQVHDDGFRAEHAAVVVLAFHHQIASDQLRVLQRIAARYRVGLVPIDELEHAAGQHGSPLPDELRPPAVAAMPPGPELRPPEPYFRAPETADPRQEPTGEELVSPPIADFDGKPLRRRISLAGLGEGPFRAPRN